MQPDSEQTLSRVQRRSRGRSSTSLVALLFALQGQKLTVELRDDVMITGVLDEVDEYMNMHMGSVVWTPVEGPSQIFESMFVRGRNLRLVHLPSGMDAAVALDQHIAQLKKDRVTAALAAINRRHTPVPKGVDGAAADSATAGSNSATAASSTTRAVTN